MGLRFIRDIAAIIHDSISSCQGLLTNGLPAARGRLLTSGPVPARQTFYWHYPHYHGSTWAPGSAIRDGDWKLIEFLEENTVELYDLKDDVGERTNLAAQNPERVKMLQAKLDAWRSKTGASMPKPNASAGAENIGTATNSKKK